MEVHSFPVSNLTEGTNTPLFYIVSKKPSANNIQELAFETDKTITGAIYVYASGSKVSSGPSVSSANIGYCGELNTWCTTIHLTGLNYEPSVYGQFMFDEHHVYVKSAYGSSSGFGAIYTVYCLVMLK